MKLQPLGEVFTRECYARIELAYSWVEARHLCRSANSTICVKHARTRFVGPLVMFSGTRGTRTLTNLIKSQECCR